MQSGGTDNTRFGVRFENKNFRLVHDAGPCPFPAAGPGSRRFIFGKTLFGPRLLKNWKIMHGPDPGSGPIGGAFTGGDKPRRYFEIAKLGSDQGRTPPTKA
jgi:hypothetical protein